ncbi:MAG: D-alanine--D-alanine ligase [Lachnospiraceae bacterium]|jgi:D-alanine-D-alanine ligase|nr:D-alanine--D-alanine ligase [Lachnospiraceae bacterium]
MKIAVLAGGISSERDVSLSSGGMIYYAFRERGHKAVLLDVYLGIEGETEGIFDLDTDWAAQIGGIREENPDIEAVKAQRSSVYKGFFGPNVLKICREADCVFLALHGANGEDGRIQACFDLLGIPYTGADFAGSCLAMDKGITKDLFRAYGIPSPEGIRLKRGESESRRIPYPCIVKACCCGSSIGVSIAENEEEYQQAKAEAFRYGDEVLVEQYIRGREFSVGVIDGRALPVIEMAPLEGFYDYRNKYQAGAAVETCPAEIEPEKAREMQEISEKVFSILRLKSYARMDFIMSSQGEIYCLEANTLPGMTPTSLLPQEAAAAGMDFGELCEEILRLAFAEKEGA